MKMLTNGITNEYNVGSKRNHARLRGLLRMIGEIVRNYREKAGLSRQELSRRCGVSARVIETIETDKHETSVFNIAKVCDELNVTRDDWEKIENYAIENLQSPQHLIDLLEYLVSYEKLDKAKSLLNKNHRVTNKEQAMLLELYHLQIQTRLKCVSEGDIHAAIARSSRWPSCSVFANIIYADWLFRNENYGLSYKVFSSQKICLENLMTDKDWKKSLYVRLLDLLAYNAYNVGKVKEAIDFATRASEETYCGVIRARMFLLLSSCYYKTEFEKAVEFVNKAKELYNLLGNEYYEKICNMQLLHIHLYNNVIDGVDGLIDSVSQLRIPNSKSELLYYHVKKRNTSEVIRLASEIEESDSDYAKAYMNLYLAEYFHNLGDTQECINCLYKAIYYFKKCGNNSMIIECIQILNHLGVAKVQLLAIAGGIIEEGRDIGEKGFGAVSRGCGLVRCG